MKAEHRKELETNVLADRVGRALKGFKEAPSRGTVLTLVAIIVVAVLYIVWSLVSQHSKNTNSELWERWYALATPTELATFAKEHDKTLPGRLAQFRSARIDLAQGLADFGNPLQRKQALDKLRLAAKTYEGLIDESSALPLLQQEAMLNAGKAYETLEDVEKAKSLYQRLVRDIPVAPDKQPPLAVKEATASLQRLETTGVRDLEMLKKLAKETGKPIPPLEKPDPVP